MTQDNWQDCPTIESVVEAKKRGDEIEYSTGDHDTRWFKWPGDRWNTAWRMRYRPAKPKTKTVVYEELEINYAPKTYVTVLVPKGFAVSCRYTGNERIEEVPE